MAEIYCASDDLIDSTKSKFGHEDAIQDINSAAFSTALQNRYHFFVTKSAKDMSQLMASH